MEIKKYRAKTIREAVGKVKNALGQEAMIISTRKLGGEHKNKGFEIAAVPTSGDVYGKNSDFFGEVKSELMSIKEMIYLLSNPGITIQKMIMNPGILNLYAKLIRNGVNDQNAKVILERTGIFNESPLDHSSNVREKTIKEIMKVIEVNEPFHTIDKNQIIAAFIGTTGVGKTTTIAKLAAQLMIKARKTVGLMSVDNYRIGAMEQLKTYANILGIPCFPAFNKKDLVSALKRMKGKDIVLIDTAGQSQYDMPRIEELKKMIADDLAISSHLLLSVATTEAEMRKTAANFAPLKFESYIFTKIDEAERCGSVLNQIMKLKLPISYITTGQNVPEDIEKANKENILNLLLNRN